MEIYSCEGSLVIFKAPAQYQREHVQFYLRVALEQVECWDGASIYKM